MPKIRYRSFRLKPATLDMIAKSNTVLEDYAQRGYDLTLRQLYYQHVAHDSFPDDRRWRWTGTKWVRDPNGTKNALPNYKWLGDVIDSGRLAGLVDWNHITDRTRNLKSLSSFSDADDVIAAAENSYHLARWANQEYRVETWVEKEALVGIFARVCQRWDVPYFACRGYTSQSEMWRAALRLKSYAKEGWQPVILHFGDHDPSGIDMTRDIQDRLTMFGANIEVDRLALNMDQVHRYSPPPNPAKQTDARFKTYMAAFGDESWELDALDPDVLAGLVEAALKRFIDPEKWMTVVDLEIEGKALLRTCSEKWEEISEHIQLEYPNAIVEAEDALEAEEKYKREKEKINGGKKK